MSKSVKAPLINAAVKPLVAIVFLLLMVAWMAGIFDTKLQPGMNELTAALDASSALEVTRKTLSIIEPVPASVEAKYATLISSRILARITAIHVRAGDTVSKGQKLIELEKSDLIAKSEQAKENIKAVNARLVEAKQNLIRVEKLNEQRLVALVDVDKARANHASLTAELALAQQQKKEAETALSYTEIRSPINGRIVDRFAEPGDTASPGGQLLSLYNPLSLRVEAHVREQLALSLKVGQSLRVDIPSLNKIVDAQIDEIVPAADTGSRSFLVKARIEYAEVLLPGMYARLLISAGIENSIVIPADRVVQVGQLNVVWVLQDEQSYRRFIRLGKVMPSGEVEVLSGLSEGDVLLQARPVSN